MILHVALDAAEAFSPLASGGGAPVDSLSFMQVVVGAAPDWPCANLPKKARAPLP
jgi:hypothetical protein